MKSLSRRLLQRVLSVYLGVTVLIFGVQVAVEYHEVQQDVVNELNMLHRTFGQSMSLALWNFDQTQVNTTLEGILNMPSVSQVAVLMPNGQVIKSMGNLAQGLNTVLPGSYTSRQRLIYQVAGRSEDLGWLELHASGEVIVRRLVTGLVLTAAAALLKTALLVFLVNLFFKRMLSRPLLRIANVASSIDPKAPPVNPLPVRQSSPGTRDELDMISHAINSLCAEVTTTVNALDLLNKDLESQVQQRTAQLQTTRESLLQSEKSLGGLVAGIAHEINTPVGLSLTGTSHFKYMVEKLETQFRAGELEEPEFERFLADSKELARSIFLSLEKAAALVRSFKLVAVDQGSDSVRRFNFKQYLEDILLTHRPLLRKARVDVALVCDAELVLTTFPGAWAQILSNLINNAIIHAFIPAPPEPRIDITVEVCGAQVVLRFRDNGNGMTESVAKQVYAPFYTTNRQGGGSGLGMHIVSNLVTQQLQGIIALDTGIGAGSVFTIKAPQNIPLVSPLG